MYAGRYQVCQKMPNSCQLIDTCLFSRHFLCPFTTIYDEYLFLPHLHNVSTYAGLQCGMESDCYLISEALLLFIYVLTVDCSADALFGCWCGRAGMRCIQSVKLLYAGPSMSDFWVKLASQPSILHRMVK